MVRLLCHRENWLQSLTFFNITRYLAFSEMFLQCRATKYVLRDKNETDILMMTAFVNRLRTFQLEYTPFMKILNINRHGLHRGFWKSVSNPSWKLRFRFKVFNTFVGTEVRSIKQQITSPLNLCSVQRDLRFCGNHTQNVDLTDPVGPAIIQINRYLNLTTVLVVKVKITIVLRNRVIYIRTARTYCHLYDAYWRMKFYKPLPQFLWLSTQRRSRPFKFDLFIFVNCHDAVRQAVENHIFNRVNIHEFGCIIIECNSLHFTYFLLFFRHRFS